MNPQFLARTRLMGGITLIVGIALIAAGLGRVYRVHFRDHDATSQEVGELEMVVETTTGGVKSENGKLSFTYRRKSAASQSPECTTPIEVSRTPAQTATVDESAEPRAADSPEAKTAAAKTSKKKQSPAPADEGDGKKACPT